MPRVTSIEVAVEGGAFAVTCREFVSTDHLIVGALATDVASRKKLSQLEGSWEVPAVASSLCGVIRLRGCDARVKASLRYSARD